MEVAVWLGVDLFRPSQSGVALAFVRHPVHHLTNFVDLGECCSVQREPRRLLGPRIWERSRAI